MASKRQRRRMRDRGETCGDQGRECDERMEHGMVHHGLDGRVFWVQRLGCTVCGRQTRTARYATKDEIAGGIEANF